VGSRQRSQRSANGVGESRHECTAPTQRLSSSHLRRPPHVKGCIAAAGVLGEHAMCTSPQAIRRALGVSQQLPTTIR
jgi:hypothetical protein